MVPTAFKNFMDRLNQESRRRVKLLKDRELVITSEAENLLKEIEDSDMYFLQSNVIKEGDEGKPH